MINQAWKETYTFAGNPDDKALALRVFDEVGQHCGSVAIKGDYIVICAPVKVAEAWIATFPQGWAALEKVEYAGQVDYWTVNISKDCYHAARQPAQPKLTGTQTRQIAHLSRQPQPATPPSKPIYHVTCHTCKDDAHFHGTVGARAYIEDHAGHKTWLNWDGERVDDDAAADEAESLTQQWAADGEIAAAESYGLEVINY